MDVTNLADPMEVGFYDTPGNAEAVAVAGSYAYVADGGGMWCSGFNVKRKDAVGFFNRHFPW